MKYRITLWATTAAGFAALALAASTVLDPAVADSRSSDAQHGYPSKTLLSSGETVAGETIHYPTNGPAQVTAQDVTIAPGGKTLIHRHGAPLFAYILDGEVTVDYGDRGQRTFHKGDGFLKAMAVPHMGIDNGTEPVRILAVYMGAKGTQLVIPEKKQCIVAET